MLWNAIGAVVVLTLAIAPARPALATVIGFEGFADSTPFTTPLPGLTFTNATVLTSGVSLNDLEFPPRSGDNVVFDAGGLMTIAFATPQARVGGFFTYSVPVTLTAFDAADAVLGIDLSDFGSNRGLSGEIGSIPNEFLSVASPGGIVRVTIEGDPFGGSFTLDDLTSTPAPSPLLLLAAGVAGAIVWRGRRRPAS